MINSEVVEECLIESNKASGPAFSQDGPSSLSLAGILSSRSYCLDCQEL